MLNALEPECRGPLTVATAGHVDHGKTALVAALTGTDTDRLAEEKARGLSIELGFAALALPCGRHLSVIDVPGHERFIRTMVAGASAVDCFMLVIAANEGVQPQTREHARILGALTIEQGIVAVTKTDLADPTRASAAGRELLPGVPVVVCPPTPEQRSAPVLAALDRIAQRLPGRAARSGPAVMHIDRSFTIAGAGTVVTGTLSSGQVQRGDRLVVYPGELPVRVRGVQVHGVGVAIAVAGQRVAVNLARSSRQAIGRGDVLAAGGAVQVAYAVEVEPECELTSGTVHVHHGTRATPARVRFRSGSSGVQLRCSEPLMVRPGERLILRDAARRATLGGATVTARTSPARPARPPGPARATIKAPEPLSPEPLSPAALELLARLQAHGVDAAADAGLSEADRRLLPLLRAGGMVVRLAPGRHASREAVAAVESQLRAALAGRGQMTLPELRDRLGVSRAQAKAFLDHFDTAGVTLRRADDTRVLRRSAKHTSR